SGARSAVTARVVSRGRAGALAEVVRDSARAQRGLDARADRLLERGRAAGDGLDGGVLARGRVRPGLEALDDVPEPARDRLLDRLGEALAELVGLRLGGLGGLLGRRLDTVDLELEHLLRLLDALQLPLPARDHGDAVRNRGADEGSRRVREEHLPAAGRGAAAGRADDVEAEVALVARVRLARVQADAHAEGGAMRPLELRMPALHVRRSDDGVTRAREGEEEGVALRVDLHALGGERLADDAPVLRERVAV